MTVGNRVNSDHHPVVVWLEREMRGQSIRGVNRKCWRGIWDEEGKVDFKQKVGSLEVGRRELNKD